MVALTLLELAGNDQYSELFQIRFGWKYNAVQPFWWI